MDEWSKRQAVIQKFVLECTKRDNWVDLNVDRNIILKWTLEKVWRGMDYIHLAQDRDQCRALVNTVMNLPVS
jgi:hypothetical protein